MIGTDRVSAAYAAARQAAAERNVVTGDRVVLAIASNAFCDIRQIFTGDFRLKHPSERTDDVGPSFARILKDAEFGQLLSGGDYSVI